MTTTLENKGPSVGLGSFSAATILQDHTLSTNEVGVGANGSGWVSPSSFERWALVKAMVFPVAMHGRESWTIRKADRRRIDAFELWC